MKRIFALCIIILLVTLATAAFSDGLLPSLETLTDVEMPSMLDAINRFPDTVTDSKDGSSVEMYQNISEDEFSAFGDYLGTTGCELKDYSVEGTQFSATVIYGGAEFYFAYDSATLTAMLTYPSGTISKNVQNIINAYSRGQEAFQQGNYVDAIRFLRQVKQYQYLKSQDLYVDAVRNLPDGWIVFGCSNMVYRNIDGSVSAVPLYSDGEPCDLSEWSNIVALAGSNQNIVGLRADGTVVVYGDNDHGQCNTSGWTDIVSVGTLGGQTVGVKADGTVIVTQYTNVPDGWVRQTDGTYKWEYLNTGYMIQSPYNIPASWRDVSSVTEDGNYGLLTNGRVVSTGTFGVTGYPPRNVDETNVSGWSNIVAISASDTNVIGLRSDGTVVASGNNDFGQCNVGSWRNIIKVCAGMNCTIGLTADGRLMYAGNTKSLYNLEDVVGFAKNDNRGAYTVCILADGSVHLLFEDRNTNSELFEEVRLWD